MGERSKTAVATLMGVVTLTAAVLTWRAVTIEGKASAADRRAVSESTAVQGNRLFAEVGVAATTFAGSRVAALLTEAEALEEAARQAASRGEGERAEAFTRSAETLRVLSERYRQTAAGLIVADETGFWLDVHGPRARILATNPSGSPRAVNARPLVTIEEADALHGRSIRAVVFVVILVGLVLALTVARVSALPLRSLLAGIAAAVYIVVTPLAFLIT